MKFATKLTLCITLLITLLLSVGSILTVSLNFSNNLATALEQNLRQLTMEQYALESNMQNYLNSGEAYSDAKAAELAQRFSGYAQMGYMALINDQRQMFFNGLPAGIPEAEIQKIAAGADVYRLWQGAGKHYMLLASAVQFQGHAVVLACAYDVSPVFAQRQSQLMIQLLLNGILLVISAAAVRVVSAWLTRPIERLNQASQKIAAGAYSERTCITGIDEVGQLSASFDFMAATVEQKIQEQTQELERKDNFITAFTHEVKTPTTAILGHAEMLRLSPCNAESQQRIGNVIYKEARRLDQLAGQLMLLLGLREGEASLQLVPINALLARLAEQMKCAYADFAFLVTAENIKVLAQPDLLYSLLINLVTNAVRAEPKDKAVHLEASIKDGRCQVSVWDKGIGIPAQELEKVIQLFYMVDRSRSRRAGGAGVGLHLCAQIARLHNTSLHIESELGAGTRVSFALEVADG